MLRYGYTTGTCAALAAAAATRALLSRDEPGTETLMTSKGIPVSVSIEAWGRDETGTWASVFKDAGDDSDVTDGMEIRAHVSAQGKDISIDGGEGVLDFPFADFQVIDLAAVEFGVVKAKGVVALGPHFGDDVVDDVFHIGAVVFLADIEISL